MNSYFLPPRKMTNPMIKHNFIVVTFSTILQYFNYAIFGLSSLELSKSLFPGANDKTQLLNFFSAIILTVLARPIGSVIFGSIGDLAGRKNAIIFSGITSSFGAFSVYFIPNYESAGLASSIFLIFSRMIFLAGLTGEIDGIRLYISESISQKKQNFGNGIITFYTQSGALAASLALYFLESTPEAWRLCFLIGGILGFIFSLSRIFIPESVEFAHSKEHPSKIFDLKLSQIILGQFWTIFKASIILGTLGSLYQFYIIFLPPFISLESNIDLKKIIPLFIIAYGTGGVFWGVLADKFGGEKILRISILLAIVNFGLLFLILKYQFLDLLKFQIILATFLNSGFSVPVQIFLKNRINIAIRYRIFSLSHSIGSLIISTPACFLCSKLSINYGIEYALLYPLSAIVLSYVCLRMFRLNNARNFSF